MNKFFAIAFAVLAFGMSAAVSAKIYPNTQAGLEECQRDLENGNADFYAPTVNKPLDPSKYTKEEVGGDGACIKNAYVRDDSQRATHGVVAVKPNFPVGRNKKTGKVEAMWQCSNDVGEIHVYHRPTSKVAAPTPQPEPCTTCKEVVEIEKVFIVNERVICRSPAGDRPGVWKDGKAHCPVLIVEAPVKVETPIQCCTDRVVRAPVAPPVTQAPKAPNCPGGICRPVSQLDSVTPRTDGHCVVEVKFRGQSKFIRLAPQQGTGRLKAAVALNENGDTVKGQRAVFVGPEDAFLHAGPTCASAEKGFRSDISYAHTVSMLGLPGCEYVGIVRRM
jgi:hypothetical protein